MTSEFLALPGLRGFWPGSIDSSGNAIDASGNGRTLTYNGNPTWNYTTQGGPYLALDGTGDYLSRADEAGLDILGSESYIATAKRGLSMGGWFYTSSIATTQGAMSKWLATGNLRAYLLQFQTSVPQFYISGDGTAFVNIAWPTVLSSNTWYFVCAVYKPSTSIKVFVNDEEPAQNTTSIPSALFNSSTSFEIGAKDAGTSLLTGRVAFPFLCAQALADEHIVSLFDASRGMFGV